MAIAGVLMLCEDPEQWDAVGVRGRNVVVAFDGDVRSNPDVADAERRLVAFLRSRSAMVLVARLLEPKQGLDDFLAAGGSEQGLLDGCQVPAG